jgi:hypothetical protein
VQPIAEALALPVESVDELAEGNGAEAVQLMMRMAGESAVICTHGDVAVTMLESLTPGSDLGGRAGLRLQKGEVWVVQSTGESLEIVEHLRKVSAKDRS